jgi:hypothetical protein
VPDFNHAIVWDNRFLGIKTNCGVGKTALEMEYIRLNFEPNQSVMYISLDNLYFLNTMYDFVIDFYKKNVCLLPLIKCINTAIWLFKLKIFMIICLVWT